MLIEKIYVHPNSGLKETIIQMNYLKSKAFQNQKFITWVYKSFSSDCVSCLPEKIWKYMRRYFKYEKDSPHDELIIAPYLLPDLRRGDCDDFALFAKTCFDILGGFSTYYIIFAKEKGAWCHIAVSACENDIVNPETVLVDGVNNEFNSIPEKYNYYKLL